MKDDGVFITSLYKRCFVSSLLAILGSALGQSVTAMMIGRTLGPDALSVVGITLPVYYVYATAGALLGVGGTAVCARLIGARRFEESRRAFTAVYVLTVFIAAVFTCVMLVFTGHVAGFLGVAREMELYDDVLVYIRVLSIGGVFIMSVYPAFNLLRLDGRNRAVTLVFFIMAAVNILSGALLLLVLKAGVAGAAAATATGAAAAGILGGALLFRGSKNFSFILTGMKASIRRLSSEIMLSGSPSALENLCVLIRTAALNWVIVGTLSDMAALSAFKVTDSVNSLALVFIAGASGSLIPFAGVFCVEKDVGSNRQTLAPAFKWGGAATLAFTALCMLFPAQAAGLFGLESPEAAAAIRIFVISLPLSLVNNILVCLYQAGRRTTLANLLTGGRSLLWVLLPALLLSPRIGSAGIWHSFWIGELLAFGLAALTSLAYRRKNKYLSPLFLLDTEAEKKGTYQSFSVRNTLPDIAESAAGIGGFCEANDLSPKKTMAVTLAIEEMLVSIHSHSLSGKEDQSVSVRVLILEDTLTLRIRSAGEPFSPVEYYTAASQGQSAEDLMLSDSLGIKMILDLARTVHYSAAFGVNNITIVL